MNQATFITGRSYHLSHSGKFPERRFNPELQNCFRKITVNGMGLIICKTEYIFELPERTSGFPENCPASPHLIHWFHKYTLENLTKLVSGKMHKMNEVKLTSWSSS